MEVKITRARPHSYGSSSLALVVPLVAPEHQSKVFMFMEVYPASDVRLTLPEFQELDRFDSPSGEKQAP